MAKFFRYNKKEYLIIGIVLASTISILSILFAVLLFSAFGLNIITILISLVCLILAFGYTFITTCKDYNFKVEFEKEYVERLFLKDKSESYKGACGSDFVLKD